MFGREAPRALLPAPTDPPVPPTIANTNVDIEQVEEAGLHVSAEVDRDDSSDPAPAQPAIEAIWRESDSTDIEASISFTTASNPQDELLIEAEIDNPVAGDQLYGDLTSLDQDDESLGWLAPLADGQALLSIEQQAPEWAKLGDTASQAEPTTINQLPAPPEEAPLDRRHIAHWISLLQADDPALFRLWSMELIAQPATLPTILSALTSDLAALDRSDDPRYQHALVEALTIQSKQSSHISPEHILDDEPAPDWLSLRRMGQEEVQDD
jgi:hypothetical protein